jgi:UTP:GlnB (protein PII) uridylyltransferase
LTTVAVTWFDSEAVWRAVEAHARALGARYPEIEEIVVFGSLVRGTAVPGSDVDMLVILARSDQRFLDRIPALVPGAFPCGVDVFPYTRAELERMRGEGNAFIATALSEGRTVYRR